MNAEVRKARKKPVEIEYMVWPGGEASATLVINWILASGGRARYRTEDDAHFEHLQFDTAQGATWVEPGQVILRVGPREFESLRPHHFLETYDPITTKETDQ